MSSVHLDFVPVESLAVDLNTIEASPCRDSVERQYEDLLNEYATPVSNIMIPAATANLAMLSRARG